MKKSELGTLIIGSQIENKKNGEVFTINNITEIDSKVKYQLSNDKTISASSIFLVISALRSSRSIALSTILLDTA